MVCFQRRFVDALAGVDGVEQQLGDIRDNEAVSTAAAGCDAIIHLAARVGIVGSEEDFVSVNVGGTRNVLTAAKHHHIGRVVHVSSPSVAHGGAAIIGAGADEPTTGRSRAWYAESKALAEIEALAASSPTMGVVAVRPHLVWGPGDTQLVGRIVERSRQGRLALVGGGRALVDSTYIDNAVDALVASGRQHRARLQTALDGPTSSPTASPGPFATSSPEFALPLPASRSNRVTYSLQTACAVQVRSSSESGLGCRSGSATTLTSRRSLGSWRSNSVPPIGLTLRLRRLDLGWTPAVSVDDGLARLADSY